MIRSGMKQSLKMGLERRLKMGAAMTLLSFCIFAGCRRESKTDIATDDKVLVEVGDSLLRMRDVVSRIPAGIDARDSAEMFHAIVTTWTEGRLLEQIALAELDNRSHIEQLVDDYRRRLIVMNYMQKQRRENVSKVPESAIRKYYQTHSDEMKASEPIVKGVYIKLPEQSHEVDAVRRLVRDPDERNVDRIEKNSLEEALQYDYFMDHWVPFSDIAEQIPYRFFDADAFVESTRDFETTYNGAVYLLHISDYLPTGSQLPYEYARSLISERIGREKLAERQKALIRTLYDKGVSEGLLRAPGYDLYK